ncbi:hypothetical protein NUM3379_07400 [Kineococcus sp. NUM-3379]
MKITIENLPVDAIDLADAELDLLGGIRAEMKPGSGYVCTASQAGDCWMS